MKCKVPCTKTASLSGPPGFGKRIMISTEGNQKYPIAHTRHEQCDECLQEEIKEMKKQWAEPGGADETDLFGKFAEMKKEGW